MLTLSKAQWQALQKHDAGHFVAAVADQFLSNRPDMGRHPGRDTVIARMRAAHDHAVSLGFASTPHIVRLMYLYADAPRIHNDRLIDGYLRKPGATPEQRLDDMLVLTNRNFEGNP